ncbi:MAG: collagen binding domain-containing protein [Candidatus Sericytochromatia bacterium]
MSSRFFAAAIVAVFSLTACQGGAPTTPGNQAGAPAQGQGVIKGTITTAGVIAVSEGNYRTLLQAGATVPGAHITVNGGAFNGEATSGADGSFSLTVPGGAAYTITASHPDGEGGTMKQVAIVEVPLAAEPPIVDVASLVTRRTGSIQGVIALSDGGDPEGADVFVPGTTMVGKVSAKGRFALANLPEGSWNVVFQKPGYQRAALANLSVQAGKPLVISEAVTLTKGETEGSSLKALVRDNAGRAVVGASFTATAESGTAYTAVSDGQGNISLTGLPAGNYRTQVYRSFYQVPAPGTLEVKAGETADAGTVTLASTVMHFGKVSGRLVDEAGEPVDGAIVQLDPPVTEQVFTDAQGRFTLDRVMPGEYTMRASAGGFEVNERPIMVDNRPGFVAEVGAGFVLRQPFDPARPKAANRSVPSLLIPNARLTKQGNDLLIQWEPAGLPAGLSKVAYEIDVEVGPNLFLPIATTHETSFRLPGFANTPATFQVTVRPDTSPAAYRVAQLGGTDMNALIAGLMQQMAKQSQAQRQQQLSMANRQAIVMKNLVDQARTAAAQQAQIAMQQATPKLAGGVMAIGMSQATIKSGAAAQKLAASTQDSQAKLQQLNGQMATIHSTLVNGVGKLSAGQKQTELANYEAKAKEAEAEAKKMMDEASAATQQAAAANEMMQQMMDLIRDIRDKLSSIQQSQIETTRGIARNI